LRHTTAATNRYAMNTIIHRCCVFVAVVLAMTACKSQNAPAPSGQDTTVITSVPPQIPEVLGDSVEVPQAIKDFYAQYMIRNPMVVNVRYIRRPYRNSGLSLAAKEELTFRVSPTKVLRAKNVDITNWRSAGTSYLSWIGTLTNTGVTGSNVNKAEIIMQEDTTATTGYTVWRIELKVSDMEGYIVSGNMDNVSPWIVAQTNFFRQTAVQNSCGMPPPPPTAMR
jgi:hypothetical protein